MTFALRERAARVADGLHALGVTAADLADVVIGDWLTDDGGARDEYRAAVVADLRWWAEVDACGEPP